MSPQIVGPHKERRKEEGRKTAVASKQPLPESVKFGAWRRKWNVSTPLSVPLFFALSPQFLPFFRLPLLLIFYLLPLFPITLKVPFLSESNLAQPCFNSRYFRLQRPRLP